VTPRSGLSALSLLLLAGCASLRSPAPPAEVPPVPAAWSVPSEATAPVPDAAWWRAFGDPLLDRLVAQALAADTDLHAAVARVAQARAARAQAAAGDAFTLAVGGGAQASRREGQGTGTRSTSATLDAGWEPDLNGATAAAVAAAEADLQAAGAGAAFTRVSVAAELVLAYLELRGAQQRLAVADANLASQQETLQIARWRAQAGLASTLDVDQAESAAAQTRASRPVLQTTVAQQAHAIAVLTGQAPASLRADLEAPAALPALPQDFAAVLPAELLRRRPDVAAAEAKLRAAAARIAAADAERLPRLSLGGTLGLSALTLSGLGQPGAALASLSASLDLPLRDGGRRRAQVQAQEAAWDEARAAWRGSVLAALQEVEDGLVAIRDARTRQADLAAAVAAARRAADLADTRHAAGLVDFATVLGTRRSLLTLEDSAASAATALVQQQVRLVKALGGGWTPDIPSTPSP
jgi:NodT family efflux transporter outer membrane factor (OMF) lipoprotein